MAAQFSRCFFLGDFSQHFFRRDIEYADCSRCSCMRAYVSGDMASINGIRDEDDEEKICTKKRARQSMLEQGERTIILLEFAVFQRRALSSIEQRHPNTRHAGRIRISHIRAVSACGAAILWFCLVFSFQAMMWYTHAHSYSHTRWATAIYFARPNTCV